VEKRRNDLGGAEVRVVNVALILQGIRADAAKRRSGEALLKLWNFSELEMACESDERRTPEEGTEG
jgi:hypothetical protein